MKINEHMKVRLLNAGHSAIGYLGALAGLKTIHETVENPVIQQFLQRFLADAALTVSAPKGVSIADYQTLLVDQFKNPTLADQTLRIFKDGAAKIPGFILPSLLKLLEKGGDKSPHVGSYAMVLACWYRFIAQAIEQGVFLDDSEAQTLAALYAVSNGSAKVFYQDQSLFGPLAQYQGYLGLVDAFAKRMKKETALAVVASL